MRTRSLALALAVTLGAAGPLGATAVAGVTLRGSHDSMVRQNEVAREEDYTFLRTPAQVRAFEREGYLVPVEGDADLAVAAGVSYPVARPELRDFLRALAPRYREACGERLTVTSLTRPLSAQPGNAHPLSVHPAGMAADLRVSQEKACRAWLEDELLALESEGLLDVTREHHPPHYHVALFPSAYRAHAPVASLEPDTPEPAEPAPAAATPAPVAPPLASGFAQSPPPAPPARPSRAAGPIAAVLGLAAVAILRARRRRRVER